MFAGASDGKGVDALRSRGRANRQFFSLSSSAPTIEKIAFAVEPFEGEVEKENPAEGGGEAEGDDGCGGEPVFINSGLDSA